MLKSFEIYRIKRLFVSRIQYDHLSLIQCRQTFTMVRIYHKIRELTRKGLVEHNRTRLMTYLAVVVIKASPVSRDDKTNCLPSHKMFGAVLFPREFAFCFDIS